MNATERAEKVHEEVNRRCLAYHTVRDACVKSIAAELEAYAAERVSEAVCAEIERQRISWKQTCAQAVEEVDSACKKCKRAYAFYCAECFEGEKQAAVDEESTLRMDWNYVIEELEAVVKAAETVCNERVRRAVEAVAIADCAKCRRGYGTWCEVCAIHEANANYRMGKAEAYEDAAKIAEAGPPPGGVVHVDGDVRDPGAVVTGFQKWIAARIRALKIGDGK